MSENERVSISANLAENSMPHQDGRVAEWEAGFERQLNLAIFGWKHMQAKRPPRRVDPVDRAPDETHLRISLHEIDFPLQSLRKTHVIGVHDSNVRASRMRACRIPRLRQTTRRDLVNPDPAVFGCVAGRNRFGVVGGAEVNNDELEICERLPQNALHRLSEKTFNIAYCHGDRNC